MAAAAERLLAPLRSAARRMGLRDLVAWWLAELAGLLPPAWRERFTARSVAFVCLEGDVWRELRGAGGVVREAGRADLAAMDAAGRRAAFRRLLAGGPGAAGNVWLVLAERDVLVRAVTLPLAAEEALRDTVGFELDRFTPFAASQACFDFRVKGRDAAAQTLSLDLAVANRDLVDRRLAELREVGATVVGVCPGESRVGEASPLNLLAADDRARPAVSGPAVAARVLAAIAAMLAVAALVVPLWQKRSTVIALLPRMHAAKAGADAAETLARQIEVLAGEHNFVAAKKHAQVPMVMLVEELSRLLPDGTWVQQLEVKPGAKGRDLQIWGETASSSQLIEVLEKSGLVANANYRSPLTKGVTPNTERFFLGAELKPRPVPEPIPESALVAPAATGAAGISAPAAVPMGAVPPAPAAPAPAPAKPAAGK